MHVRTVTGAQRCAWHERVRAKDRPPTVGDGRVESAGTDHCVRAHGPHWVRMHAALCACKSLVPLWTAGRHTRAGIARGPSVVIT